MNEASGPERRVRLADVARAAGVSLGTASNVFARPERVRPELRERVETAARRLDYVGPDPRARLLRAGKVHALGVIPPAGWGAREALANPIFRAFLTGVGEVCDANGASLVIARHAGAVVDGFIFGRIDHLDEVEPARLRRLPFVVMDDDAGPRISSVRVDARAGAAAAARRLLALGHRRFAILSFLREIGPARVHPAGLKRPPDAAGMAIDREKLAGYAEALAEAGLSVDDAPMVQADPWDATAAAMLLDLAPEATAVLSMTAMQALQVMREAARRGRPVPQALSVVGFNDLPEAAAAGLTTVDGMNLEKGRAAARLVFEAGPPRQVLLPAPLIERTSTAPPP